MAEHTFSNREIADILNKIAAAYEVKNEDKFRIMAYQQASASVEHSTSELKDLWDDGELDTVPGVGKNIARHLDELFKTGKVKHFDKVTADLPKSMFLFLKIPGIGPKSAYKLAENLKIKGEKDAIKKLKQAANEGKIRKIEDFGEKSEKEILDGIIALKKGEMKTRRMLLPYADGLATEIITYLKNCSDVINADPLGSLRRMMATIGDIDISVSTNNPSSVMDYFEKFKKIKNVLKRGEQSLIRVVLFSGQQIDIRFSLLKSYGAMLQHFTGSKLHNIKLREFSLKKGLSLSEYGIKSVKSSKLKVFNNEESFYNFLGLDWIPPELREGRDEIAAAMNNELPDLVKSSEIKGDLHIHSDFLIEPSHDLGLSNVNEYLKMAKILNYEYIGFSEHNPSKSGHKEEDSVNLLKRKKEYIEDISYSFNRVNKLSIKVFNGLEIDIRPYGELSIPEKGYEYLDYAIASIHSNFNLSKEKMTKRVIAGISHPKVKIFGHPTGRLLEEREGYELDWDIIFDYCLKNNKYLEISAWPNRMDLPDTLVREAIKYGLKLIINTDSHHVDQMVFMKYGVSVARRGWAEKKDILNCLPKDKFNDILNRKIIV